MDGILLLLISWFIVAVLCYFFILTYNNRHQHTTAAGIVPSVCVDEFGTEEHDLNKRYTRRIGILIGEAYRIPYGNRNSFFYKFRRFLNELSNWLIWGQEENAVTREQRLGTSLAKFVAKSLNEASRRLRKEVSSTHAIECVSMCKIFPVAAGYSLWFNRNAQKVGNIQRFPAGTNSSKSYTRKPFGL